MISTDDRREPADRGRIPFEKWERRCALVAAVWALMLMSGGLVGFLAASGAHRLMRWAWPL